MSETATKKPASKPVEGKVVEAGPATLHYEDPRPMSKAEAGVLGTLVLAVFGGIAWAIKTDVKNQKEWAAEAKAEREERERKAEETRKARQKWFDDCRAAGLIVVETRDGKYMAIPADAYAKAQVKKKGEWL